jgi:transposase-like protein
MEGYPMSAVERAMKAQAVILQAISGQLRWWQAAEILGVSRRTMRRWKQRYVASVDLLSDRELQVLRLLSPGRSAMPVA